MPIELHCPQCQKLIRAPDDAGGRTGKCPYCKASVYIPTPPAEEEEIGLAPLDESELEREDELRREAIRYAAAMDEAVEPGPDSDAAGERGHSAGSDIDYDQEIGIYIQAMHASRLEEAAAAAARIRRGGPRAREHIERLLMDDIPPEFDDVPPPLAKGFLKRLLAGLG